MSTSLPSRSDLEAALAGVEDPLRRRLTFLALLSSACELLGWSRPVVVGGHAVEFYTSGGYTTVDIDLVSPCEPLTEILGGWGFRREGRHWLDDELGLAVEAPGSHLGPGQRERTTGVRLGPGVVEVLGIEDLVVDRLNACVHSGSEEDCHWAHILLAAYRERIDLAYLGSRAREEQVSGQLAELLGEIGAAREDAGP